MGHAAGGAAAPALPFGLRNTPNPKLQQQQKQQPI
jgi:hypothetical protein